MRKFLGCGLIATLALLPASLRVAAEPPPVEPITVIGEHSDGDRQTPNFARTQELLRQQPELAHKIQTLIEKNPEFVVSIVQQTLAQYPNLIQAIQTNPQIARSIVNHNPQLVQALIANPQLLDRRSPTLFQTSR